MATYERDFWTRFGSIRLRLARTRKKNFLPRALRRFQRRADELALLIREAFLRGISTPQVGRVGALLSGKTVSPQTVSRLTRLAPQRGWVHKMRTIREKVRKRDYETVKKDAPAIYGAEGQPQAVAAFRRFRARWQRDYPRMVRQLQGDLPELLSFFRFPRHLWEKLRTTKIIQRCFVEVRRRTRPMLCFVNVESVDRIIYSIFQRFNLEWKNRTLRVFTQAAWRHPRVAAKLQFSALFAIMSARGGAVW